MVERGPATAASLRGATRRVEMTQYSLRCSAGLLHEVPVQFSVIALNVLYAVIGVVLMYVAYRAFDKLTPEVDFPAELQKGNIAVALFVASIFLSSALIIGKALG